MVSLTECFHVGQIEAYEMMGRSSLKMNPRTLGRLYAAASSHMAATAADAKHARQHLSA